jgi:hypothetical protein
VLWNLWFTRSGDNRWHYNSNRYRREDRDVVTYSELQPKDKLRGKKKEKKNSDISDSYSRDQTNRGAAMNPSWERETQRAINICYWYRGVAYQFFQSFKYFVPADSIVTSFSIRRLTPSHRKIFRHLNILDISVTHTTAYTRNMDMDFSYNGVTMMMMMMMMMITRFVMIIIYFTNTCWISRLSGSIVVFILQRSCVQTLAQVSLSWHYTWVSLYLQVNSKTVPQNWATIASFNTGVANFNPQEGHIIGKDPPEGCVRACVFLYMHISKGGVLN